MISFKWKSSAFLYSLSLFKDLKLKLKFKSEFELKLELKLLLLLILGTIKADTYQMSVDHKGDVWITMNLGKYDAEQLFLCHNYNADHTH